MQGEYTAVIIEPRVHNAWPLVLGNFLKYLDARWNFLIFCGRLNEAYLQNLITTEFPEHQHRIRLITPTEKKNETKLCKIIKSSFSPISVNDNI